jgi:hypothetical protein
MAKNIDPDNIIETMQDLESIMDNLEFNDENNLTNDDIKFIFKRINQIREYLIKHSNFKNSVYQKKDFQLTEFQGLEPD